jgi:CheY-like chemotaxis protein
LLEQYTLSRSWWDGIPGEDAERGNTLMGPFRILIIEDHIDGAQTLQAVLRLLGFEVVGVAYSGTDGVRKAAQLKPDVVISDIGLPGLDGFEVARELRHNPETAHAFLVALSGYGAAEYQETAEQAGFDYYLVKPADLAVLVWLLRRPASREDAPGLRV